MSENMVTLGCLAKHIGNKKLKFNTSKKNFFVPKGLPTKYKKLLHGEMYDSRFEELLSDPQIETLSIDMSLMLEASFYKTVNFNLFDTAYHENESFSRMIDREILSRGLGWKKDSPSSRRFVYSVWENSVFGSDYENNTLAGVMASDKEYEKGLTKDIYITGSKVKIPYIIFGYNYVWQANISGEISIDDMRRIANRRKLRGEYFYDIYFIYCPKGFNETSIKNNIHAVSTQYPQYNDMTLEEISRLWSI